MIYLSFTLNGAPVSQRVEDRTSLADLVREGHGLTGTHVGCEHGACGACTVLVDGEPARSCIVLAAMCEGRAVTTAEGLLDDPVMAELRRQFHDKHALQCGFCTPAMMISARDIIARHGAAAPATIRKELAGQICRCTGYAPIVAAIAAAGAALNPSSDAAAAAPHVAATAAGASDAS